MDIEDCNTPLNQEILTPFIAVFQRSPDACIVEAPDGRVAYWNPAAARLFGYADEDIIGRLATVLIPPELQTEESARLQAVLAGVERPVYETRRICKDGSSVYVSVSLTLLPAPIGHTEAFLMVMRDITRQKQAEASLLDREFKLDAIVSYSPSALSLKTPDGRYALANPNLQKIHHLSEEAIVGKTDFELYPEAIATAFRTNDDLVLRTMARQSIEEMVPVDGQLRNFMSHMFPVVDAAGAARFICRISLDITDKKLAEAQVVKLVQAIEQSPNSIIITNVDGIVEFVNGGFVSNTGYPRHEIVGKPFRVLGSGRTPPETYDDLWRTLGEGLTWQGEFINCRKDGSEYVTAAIISPIRQPDGRISHYVAIQEDITVRKQAEIALREAMASTQAAVEAKSRFLAAASHDLRQPLAALSLYVNVLKNKVAPADNKLVAQLKDCVDSLSGLLTDLLDLSKLDAGVVTPNAGDFSLSEMLASLESVHTPEAVIKGVQLRCRPTRLTGHTDPVLFQRIVGNLIHNAIRYTEIGGVLVTCRRRRGKTWIEVYDTGIGIPTDKKAEIFEEFRQLGDQARNSGSGLGLAIVAKTAALLGLEIRLESRPGKGSVFAIELPLGQQAAPRPALRPQKVMQLRIALVEDHPLVRKALSESLRMVGYQLVAAASLSALLAELDGLVPDVVISDYRLAQGETGFDVITALRERFRTELPAILITGDTAPALLRSMTNRGINVLHKPIELDALQACLEGLMVEASRARSQP